MTQALTRMSWGGSITIRLIGDYHLETQVYVRSGFMRIESADTNSLSKLSFAEIDAGGSARSANLYCIGNSYLYFVLLEIELGLADASLSEKGVIFTNAGSVISLVSCEFTVVAGADQALAHHGGGKSLHVYSSTYPAEMAGLWIDGVAAGTDPLTRRDIATCNLLTL